MGGYEKKLSVGRKAFVMAQGKIVNIVGATKKEWIVEPSNGRGDAYPVRKCDVQARISDVLPLGSHVCSEGTFTGTVTGYEHATNRVIVVSDKIKNYRGEYGDRTRYSYALNELDFVPPTLFKLNHEYLVVMHADGESKPVRVMEHPSNPNVFALHHIYTGKYLHAVNRALTSRDLLYSYIQAVKEL